MNSKNDQRIVPYYEDWITHDTWDEYWKQWSIQTRYSNIQVLALNFGSVTSHHGSGRYSVPAPPPEFADAALGAAGLDPISWICTPANAPGLGVAQRLRKNAADRAPLRPRQRSLQPVQRLRCRVGSTSSSTPRR